MVNLSHDVRTPLTTLLGCLDAIHRGVVTGAERDACLEIARGKACELKQTVDDLFTWSKLQAGKESLSLQDCDLADLTLPPDRLNRVLYENGLTILELHQCEDTLEDYFRQITGGEGIGWAASMRIPQAAPHPAAAAAGAGRPVAGERHGGAGRLFLGRFGRAAVQPVAVPPPESAVRRDSPLALGSRAGPVF